MTPSLIVVALGAVAAVVATSVLTARCARAPKLFLIAWTAALFCLTIALGGQALGDLAGYSGPIFRAIELGAQAIAPLSVCLGLVELAGKSVPARFAMRLAVSAVAVVGVVILGTDPLNLNKQFTKAWPDPAIYYEPVPKLLIEFLAIFTIATAIGIALVVMLRASHGGRGSSDEMQPALLGAGAAGLLALPGLSMAAGLPLPAKDLFAVACALAVALIWFAVSSAERHGLTEAGQDGDDGRYGGDQAHPARAGRGLDGADPSLANGSAGDPYADERVSGYSYPGLAALAAEPPGGGDKYGDTRRPGEAGRFQEPDHHRDPGSWDEPAKQAASDPRVALFGQITIYTLLDDRIDDFDLLTERVVDQVRAKEPGTLAFIVHAVPTAPLQRILYEVYQDRSAYDEHRSQPYVVRYEAERRRLVLATNVIELGLQQAKVSPFPSFTAISDMLSESGIDLTGVTRSSRGVGGGVPGQEIVRSPRGSMPAPDYPSDAGYGGGGGYGPPPAGWGDGNDHVSYEGADGHDGYGYDVEHDDGLQEPGHGPGRSGADYDRVDEPGYQGWAGIRGDDQGYR
jgi:quinol monooxygenase YgiN